MLVQGLDCSEKHWAICGLTDKFPSTSNYARGYLIFVVKSEIFLGDLFVKTVCLAGKKMKFDEAVDACKFHKMSFLSMEDKVEEVFKSKVEEQIGNESLFWGSKRHNGSCTAWKLQANFFFFFTSKFTH